MVDRSHERRDRGRTSPRISLETGPPLRTVSHRALIVPHVRPAQIEPVYPAAMSKGPGVSARPFQCVRVAGECWAPSSRSFASRGALHHFPCNKHLVLVGARRAFPVSFCTPCWPPGRGRWGGTGAQRAGVANSAVADECGFARSNSVCSAARANNPTMLVAQPAIRALIRRFKCMSLELCAGSPP
jgi:hypothetical protein